MSRQIVIQTQTNRKTDYREREKQHKIAIKNRPESKGESE